MVDESNAKPSVPSANVSRLVPVRARTHPLHEPRNGAREKKHGETLDVAELCKRLEALKKERRAAARQASQQSKDKAPSSKDVPYRHVPQHAAKDFTRTTAPEPQGAKESHSLSSSLPGLSRLGSPPPPKLSRRLSLAPGHNMKESELKACKRLSTAPGNTFSWSTQTMGPEHSKGLSRRASGSVVATRRAQQGRRTEKSGHHIYDSLLEADEGFRRLSMGDLDHADVAGIDTLLEEDTAVLAHKITRQHLEDRAGANWTQSDACCNNESRLDTLKELVAPLLRSLAKRRNSENSTATTDITVTEKPPDAKSLPRRRSSFLIRHFRRSNQEQPSYQQVES